MKYEVQENCLTIFLPGELDHHNAEEIRKRSDYLIDQNHIRYVIFDFTDTTFMDSSGIGLSMGRYKLLRLWNGNLVLANLAPRVEMMVKLSGADRLAVLERRESNESCE